MRRIALVALAVLILGAGALAEDVPGAVRDLGSTHSATRVKAMNFLRGRLDPAAIPLIVEAAPGFDLIGRYYAVMVLDAYPRARSVPAFRSLARVEDPYLRLCGATGLLRAGERGAAEAVAKALHAGEVDANTRTYMLNRVLSERDPVVRASVREFLVPGEDETVIGAAVNVLANQGGPEEVAAAERLLADPRPGLKAIALALLYRLGREERAEELAARIASGEVPYSQFFRVRNLLYAMRSVAEPILEAVAGLLEIEDTNVNVLNSAIGLLSKFRHTAAIPALRELLDHESRTVSKAAFEALASMPGALDRGTLLPLLDSKDADRRLQAADALRRMDEDAGLEAVLEVLRTGTPIQRSDAAGILGDFRRDEAVEPLIEALLDDYETTRMRAASGLATVLRTLYPYRRFDLATTGYDRNATPEVRAAAVEKLRAWWKANRDSDW